MTQPRWIWEFGGWPDCLLDYEPDPQAWEQFRINNQRLAGALALGDDAVADLMEEDILASFQIEGVQLERTSLRRSILRAVTGGRIQNPNSREAAALELVIRARAKPDRPVTHEMLWEMSELAHRTEVPWNKLNAEAGRYRSHPMDIGSATGKVYYQAPPAESLQQQMDAWLAQANTSAEDPLSHAAISHLWFEQIHPFGDGNGRIGRALIERQLARALDTPVTFSFSDALTALPGGKAGYYAALEYHNRYTRSQLLEVSDPTTWIDWFRGHLHAAQELSGERIAFAFQRHLFNQRIEASAGQLAYAQKEVLEILAKHGFSGFEEGLSSSKYQSISGVSRQTAARQLAQLVDEGWLVRTGERRWARYHLALRDTHNPVTDTLSKRSASAIENRGQESEIRLQ